MNGNRPRRRPVTRTTSPGAQTWECLLCGRHGLAPDAARGFAEHYAVEHTTPPPAA